MKRSSRALLAVTSPYLALGSTDDELTAIAAKLTTQLATGDVNGTGAALGVLSAEDRQTVAQKMLALGASGTALSSALAIATPAAVSTPTPWWIYVLHASGMAAGAYHGYRRNQSLGWALWWGLCGGAFPIFVPVLAIAEGFAEPKRG